MPDYVDNAPIGPRKSFREHTIILQDVWQELIHFEKVIAEVEQIAASKVDDPMVQRVGDPAMTAAIILFTFDLCLIRSHGTYQDENNFYWSFNGLLRQRARKTMEAAHGFLYLFFTGLSRLPSATGTTYRGINAGKTSIITDKFKRGKRVHFLSVSSTTPSFEVARHFAGDKGVVFRFQLLGENSKARDISAFTPFDNEVEIILMPTFTCVCTLISNVDGVEVIDLVEEITGNVQVDF